MSLLTFLGTRKCKDKFKDANGSQAEVDSIAFTGTPHATAFMSV